MWDIYCLVFACKHNMGGEETGSFLFEFYIYLPAGVRRESVCLREAVSQEAGAQEAFGTAVLKQQKENFIYFNELPAVVDVYTHVRAQSWISNFFFPSTKRSESLDAASLLVRHVSFSCVYGHLRCPCLEMPILEEKQTSPSRSHPRIKHKGWSLTLILTSQDVSGGCCHVNCCFQMTTLTSSVFDSIHYQLLTAPSKLVWEYFT